LMVPAMQRGSTAALYKVTEHIVSLSALTAGYGLLLLAIITAIEIIARKLFNYSFQGVDEIGGYVLAITASLGFGYALMTRTHTRVDFILRMLPLGIRGFFHLAAMIILLAISIGMLWYAYSALMETLEYGSIANSPLETPLWIPQSLWLAGFVAFALIAALWTVRAAVLFVRGNFRQLDADFGLASVEEEIAAVDDVET